MLKVRVTMLNGETYIVESKLNIDEFDNNIRFSAPTDFLTSTGGTRIQINKVLAHQPLEESTNG